MDFDIVLVTARSVVIKLKEEGYYNTDEYDIYLNGSKYISSNKMVQTLYGLRPDTSYILNIKRGKATSETIEFKTSYEFVTLNVRDFGAKGDGVSDDTKYIQAAIMTCPENSRVYIPEGVYKFTNLFLKSNMILEIGKKATLSAIVDKSQHPILPGRIESYDEEAELILGTFEGNPMNAYASLITGIGVDNVLIHGEGRIDGGADFNNWWNVEKRRNDPATRPKMLFLNKCSNIIMQGLTITNSPCWNLHPFFSKNLKFIDLTIKSPSKSHNTDGLNPESCTDVDIIGTYFSVGDDCIAIKSGKIYLGKKYKTPSKNIVIRHCYMKKGHGAVTIGSEIGAGVDGIYVSNCYFSDTDRGLRIKTRRGRGKDSVLDGISFEKIKMDHVKTPFVVNSFYYCGPDGKTDYVGSKEAYPVDEGTPSVKKLIFKDIECTNSHVAGAYIYGLPEKKIESIEMKNIYISYADNTIEGKAAMMAGCERSSKQGVFIRNVENLSIDNVIVEGNVGKSFDIK